MKSRLGQYGCGLDGNLAESGSWAPPEHLSAAHVHMGAPSNLASESDQKKGEDLSKRDRSKDSITRSRTSSTTIPSSPTRRQASNSQRILDVLTIAQQVGSKAIAGT